MILSLAVATLGVSSAPALAQVHTIDPNQVIDSDLNKPQTTPPPPADDSGAAYQAPAQSYPPQSSAPQTYPSQSSVPQQQYPPYNPSEPGVQANAVPENQPANTALHEANADAATAQTFKREEILSAAEGTFGKGAAGLAGILERTLKEQGEPNAYISGREASGAIALGLRYGQGTMFHKVEGQMPVYWTGPSFGFDLGGDATKVFVLVYNLYDTEELFRRFPAGEGRLYFVGGFAATYLRRGNTVLIPIRLGVGWRQGVNVGYMKFSHKSRWFPF
ncbi:EipA family protein [Sphingomonas oligophenolica]|uniref:EipA family protein n=1 Tax=Sphingomonas oligophenolica TaxID=301154 RepID=A0ABU9Y5N9_9SPHN